ncbi:MAG: DUF481 domain-containing protein [Acidobacteriota bacterium]|nr:DUF481 domain-containing protein [Acidobacteriota bacterium]
MNRCLSALGCFLLISVAQAGEKGAWSDKAELSGVFTSGNSESSNLGFSNELGWQGGPATFDFDVSAVRAESDDPDTGESNLTAENYSLGLLYNRKFNKRTSWYAGLDWKQDEFAGVKSRTGLSAGLGHDWIDTETRKFKTSYGVKQVSQEDVFEPVDYDGEFLALNLRVEHFQTVTKTSNYEQTFVADINGEDSEDFRVDWKHGFSVTVSERVAIKLGLKLIYDNLPPFADDIRRKDELDTILTTSLVINF